MTLGNAIDNEDGVEHGVDSEICKHHWLLPTGTGPDGWVEVCLHCKEEKEVRPTEKNSGVWETSRRPAVAIGMDSADTPFESRDTRPSPVDVSRENGAFLAGNEDGDDTTEDASAPPVAGIATGMPADDNAMLFNSDEADSNESDDQADGNVDDGDNVSVGLGDDESALPPWRVDLDALKVRGWSNKDIAEHPLMQMSGKILYQTVMWWGRGGGTPATPAQQAALRQIVRSDELPLTDMPKPERKPTRHSPTTLPSQPQVEEPQRPSDMPDETVSSPADDARALPTAFPWGLDTNVFPEWLVDVDGPAVIALRALQAQRLRLRFQLESIGSAIAATMDFMYESGLVDLDSLAAPVDLQYCVVCDGDVDGTNDNFYQDGPTGRLRYYHTQCARDIVDTFVKRWNMRLIDANTEG